MRSYKPKKKEEKKLKAFLSKFKNTQTFKSLPTEIKKEL